MPDLPRAWIVKNSPIQSHRSPPTADTADGKIGMVRRLRVNPNPRGANLRHRRNSRRSAAADLYLLPPSTGDRGASCFDAADAGRT
ncbi:hypothetical protein [Nostoc sp. 'Peltigera malacea cyanobiont' DB3992]|uniref:hypothetical protein n=1 Tax=Nostoc sp. 'Peltigera malacea cyanobiont' DB3992 TaxID=1206980 RepID=UPI00211E8621|nr:hypothetical protein [Nostoc sp. 'Peltigera malacea cyanobiont' DB3992]